MSNNRYISNSKPFMSMNAQPKQTIEQMPKPNQCKKYQDLSVLLKHLATTAVQFYHIPRLKNMSNYMRSQLGGSDLNLRLNNVHSISIWPRDPLKTGYILYMTHLWRNISISEGSGL
jgi:hypothetical protein